MVYSTVPLGRAKGNKGVVLSWSVFDLRSFQISILSSTYNSTAHESELLII
jgi:hypothetical protein